jgi:hypothetical protein
MIEQLINEPIKDIRVLHKNVFEQFQALDRLMTSISLNMTIYSWFVWAFAL